VGSVAHGGGPSRLAALEPAARPAAPAAGGRSSPCPLCRPPELAARSPPHRPPEPAARPCPAANRSWPPRTRRWSTMDGSSCAMREDEGTARATSTSRAGRRRVRRFDGCACSKEQEIFPLSVPATSRADVLSFFPSFVGTVSPRARFRVPCCLLLRFLVPTASRRRARSPPSEAPPSRSWWTPLELTLPLELEAVAEERGADAEGGGASSSGGGRRDRPTQDRWKRRRRRSVLVEWW
jgi:hypothetical protein